MIDHLKGREKALEPFGLTGRRAEWIALASPHGGVFTCTQRDGRLAAEETVGELKVCRICACGIYRALGAEGVRHRRITSPGVVLRRLLAFDYVMEHTGLPWLPTEPEKVAAFEALDIGRSLLPVRVYRGASGGARRYFPRGMPVALDSSRAVFVHTDPGYDTSTALRSWRDRHLRLWEALRELGWSRSSGSQSARGNSAAHGRSWETGSVLPAPKNPTSSPRLSHPSGARSCASRMPSGEGTRRRSRNWAVSTAAFTASLR